MKKHLVRRSVVLLACVLASCGSLFAMRQQTPEPSSFALVGIGLAAGGFAVYRSRRNKR